MTQTEEKQFACELAKALDDIEAIQIYSYYVQQFPENVLRKTLLKVLSLPECKTRNIKGALFNYLIQQYAVETKCDPRD